MGILPNDSLTLIVALPVIIAYALGYVAAPLLSQLYRRDFLMAAAWVALLFPLTILGALTLVFGGRLLILAIASGEIGGLFSKASAGWAWATIIGVVPILTIASAIFSTLGSLGCGIFLRRVDLRNKPASD